MAADEDKTTVEIPEGGEGGARKKGSNKMVLFGGIGAVVVIGIVVALFVVKPMMSGSDSGAGEGEIHATEQAEESSHAPAPKKKKSSGGHGPSESMVYAIKDIVVNPAGTGGTRFLSVSFGFELQSSALASEFESREPLVRDALITILASKTVAQLTDAKQKEIIRYQVKKRLAKLMNTDEIAGVYYTDFVLQ
ncbi:MAG: flagellar basal body-associated FliL family protein [candidate division Zixibacteria bacterium]|nr:flagellar basal body-associated FliL family protein [candidate division Zixibacteria bacterium]